MDDASIIIRHVGSKYTTVKLAELNSTSLCNNQIIPDAHTYFTALGSNGIILGTLGAFAVLTCFILFVDTIRSVRKNGPKHIIFDTSAALSVYSVVALASFIAICMPRTQLICEAIGQGAFMIAAYKMFCVQIAYCGGVNKLVEYANDESLVIYMRTGPCCCWPCCRLPSPTITKERLSYLRYAIMQLPFMQIFFYLVLIILWAEDEGLYHSANEIVQILCAVSILTGMWGLTMTIRMLGTVLPEHKVNLRFGVLQLVLGLSKIQMLIMRILSGTNSLPCTPPILTKAIYLNLIFNGLMLVEMVLLSIWARSLYRHPLPGVYNKNNNGIDITITSLPEIIDVKNPCVIENMYVNEQFINDDNNPELKEIGTVSKNIKNISNTVHQ